MKQHRQVERQRENARERKSEIRKAGEKKGNWKKIYGKIKQIKYWKERLRTKICNTQKHEICKTIFLVPSYKCTTKLCAYTHTQYYIYIVVLFRNVRENKQNKCIQAKHTHTHTQFNLSESKLNEK